MGIPQEKEESIDSSYLLYKDLKGKASLPTDDLTRSRKNHHSLAFQTPTAGTDIYKGNFFPQTIRNRNVLPQSVTSCAEVVDDCVAKFTSLVRVRTTGPVKDCQF